ncbi:MAG: MarR family transcriptional regulator [Fimbriimonadaceae bacterium]|nr:MarR family transcriptional regulator [Fimbriimonadaceae bacterium]
MDQPAPQPDAVALAGALLHANFATMAVVHVALRYHEQSGVSLPQFRLLVTLRDQPDSSGAEAAELMRLSRPALSRLADGLVARGLVARATDPADRRRVSLALSPAGHALIAAVDQSVLHEIAVRIERMSAAEREQVRAACRVLSRLFEPDLAKDGPPFPPAIARPEPASD